MIAHMIIIQVTLCGGIRQHMHPCSFTIIQDYNFNKGSKLYHCKRYYLFRTQEFYFT